MFYPLGYNRASLLAILVVLPASLLFADWGDSDRAVLRDIQSYTSYINPDLRDLFSSSERIVRNTSSVTNQLKEILECMFQTMVDSYDGYHRGFAVSVKDFDINGYTPYVTPETPFDSRYSAQLLVTNVAETALLEKIYNLLSTRQSSNNYTNLVFPLSGGAFTSEGIAAFLGDPYSAIDYFYVSFEDYLADPSIDNLYNLYAYFTLGQQLSTMGFMVFDWTLLPDDLYQDLQFLAQYTTSNDIYTWGIPEVEAYGKSYQLQYGTYYLNTLTNFFYSMISGNTTNDLVLSAITDMGQYSSIFSSDVTNGLTSIADSVVPDSSIFAQFQYENDDGSISNIPLPSVTEPITLSGIQPATNNAYTTPFSTRISDIVSDSGYDNAFKTDLDEGFRHLDPLSDMRGSDSGILYSGFKYGGLEVDDFYIYPRKTELYEWGRTWIRLIRILMWIGHVYVIIYLMQSFLMPGQDKYIVPSGPNGGLEMIDVFGDPDT